MDLRSGSISTRVTLWPTAAKHAPVTSPTYPAPTMAIGSESAGAFAASPEAASGLINLSPCHGPARLGKRLLRHFPQDVPRPTARDPEPALTQGPKSPPPTYPKKRFWQTSARAVNHRTVGFGAIFSRDPAGMRLQWQVGRAARCSTAHSLISAEAPPVSSGRVSLPTIFGLGRGCNNPFSRPDDDQDLL